MQAVMTVFHLIPQELPFYGCSWMCVIRFKIS